MTVPFGEPMSASKGTMVASRSNPFKVLRTEPKQGLPQTLYH